MQHRRLRGRRIAVLAADGFEKVELTVPVVALRLAGAKVDIISLRRGRIRGVNLHEPASRVHVDGTVYDTDPRRYDGLLIPGGFINPDLLRQSAEARAFVQWFDQTSRPIASLCHGPWVLASAGCLKDRVITSWPGIRDDVINAGAIWLDEEVVRDGNLVTSRGPQDLFPFIRAIKKHFAQRSPIRREPPQKLRSAPQRQEPPQLMLAAMKWMPRPSFRTAIGLGALALGVFASQSNRPSRRSVQSSNQLSQAAVGSIGQ